MPFQEGYVFNCIAKVSALVQVCDQLSMAISKICDVTKAEDRTMKLIKNAKELYLKYHAQSLVRYKLEVSTIFSGSSN